jgi:gliding motility-associated protein GldM
MINLMYLVLTAMLALNVSAEIINAFFALEKGINNSSAVMQASNDFTAKSLAEWVVKTPKEAPWNEKAKQAVAVGKEFEGYVDQLHDLLFKEAGGPHPDHHDRPYHYKDKDVTTRLFVNDVEKRGDALEKKIKDTHDKLLTFLNPEDRAAFETKLPLVVDSIPHDAKESGVKTWAELKFRQMPVAAVMPTFAKIKNDSKVSTSAILNYCMDKASGKLDIKLDKFILAIAPKKAYLISGRDKFEADIVVGAYSSTANNIKISTGSMKDGVSHYSGGVEQGTGEKTFSASASITNPATGQVTSVKSDFKYEVGAGGFGTVSADKMNVFYIGVDNPISIVAAGVSTSKLQVSASGAGANMTGTGKSRVVKVTSPGDCKITISGGDEMPATSFPFRAKRIPDPIAKLGKDVSGNIGAASFKAQAGIMAVLENFDFDARCEIQSFELTRQPKREDPVTKMNQSGKYDAQSAAMVASGKAGDMFYFDNVKARCPGDVAGRKVNPLVFKLM